MVFERQFPKTGGEGESWGLPSLEDLRFEALVRVVSRVSVQSSEDGFDSN